MTQAHETVPRVGHSTQRCRETIGTGTKKPVQEKNKNCWTWNTYQHVRTCLRASLQSVHFWEHRVSFSTINKRAFGPLVHPVPLNVTTELPIPLHRWQTIMRSCGFRCSPRKIAVAESIPTVYLKVLNRNVVEFFLFWVFAFFQLACEYGSAWCCLRPRIF